MRFPWTPEAVEAEGGVAISAPPRPTLTLEADLDDQDA